VTLNPEFHVVPPRLSLKRRVLNAGGWLFVGYGLTLTIRLTNNLLMTRLLMPEVFGVMAMATIVLIGLAMFSDLGLKQCIVRSERGHDHAFLNTAWTIQILQGALLWMAALTVSALVWVANQMGAIPRESAYADPILPSVIALLSSAVLINGLASTKCFEASRNLRFGSLAMMDIISQAAGMIGMLVWVSIDRSIWALVAGGISGSIVRTCLSHLWLAGPTNRWQWDNAAFREIVRFGKWIFVSSILGFLVNNGDRLLLGGMVDSHLLGVYAIAFLLYSAIEQVLGTVLGEITFPALSEIVRERRVELKPAYYRFQLIVASLSYAAAGALIVGGPTIVASLYDQRYRSAGWMLEVLAVGLLAIPWRSASLCYLALGKPQILSYSAGVRLTTLVVAVPVGFKVFGMMGAVGGVALAQLSTVPMIVTHMAKGGLLDVRKELLLLLIAPASALVAQAIVVAIGTAEGASILSALVQFIGDVVHLRVNVQGS
jgi:O-antigen/teichoic acid export membrane protein